MSFDFKTFNLEETYGRFLDQLTAEYVIGEPRPEFPEEGILVERYRETKLYPWYASETINAPSPKGAWYWTLDMDDEGWEPLNFCMDMETTLWAVETFMEARRQERRSERMPIEIDYTVPEDMKYSATYQGYTTYAARIEFALLKCMLSFAQRQMKIRGVKG